MKRLAVTQWQELSFHNNLIKYIKEHRPTNILFNGGAEFEMPGQTGHFIELLEHTMQVYNVHMDYIVGCEGIPKAENGRPNRPLVNTTLHNFPMYWLYQSYTENISEKFNFEELRDRFQPSNFTKLFTSLNNLAHPHRAILIDELHKKDLLDKGHTSFRNPENLDVSEYLESWTQEKLFLDEIENRGERPEHFIPEHIIKSPISVIAESQPDLLFITEKTWFPIFLKKPFLILSAQNFHTYLTYYGFRLNTELFDYSFDQKTDVRERARGIAENLEKVQNLSYQEIYERTREVCEHNYNRAVEIVTNELFIPPVVQHYRLLGEGEVETDTPLSNLVGF